MRITVVGLGKLGAPIAAVYAAAGHQVIGVDLSQRTVDLVNAGLAPSQEPSLQDLMMASTDRLRATTDWSEAMAESEMSVVIVPTPSMDDGTFSNDHVLSAVNRIGGELRKQRRSDHIVVIASTVMPGSMDGPIREALERSSGSVVGEGVGLAYSPQFIALGSVIKNLREPDMVLIGACDERVARVVEETARSFAWDAAQFRLMGLVNAEIVKLAVNTFVTTKISFANMLSEICDSLVGADIDVVTQAVGSDTRIGARYLSGGLGYGGPCFPRDNIALSALAMGLGHDATIAVATDRVNDRQVERLCATVRKLLPGRGRVDVWGLAYKTDTDVVEASQGLAIARELSKSDYDVWVHDPMVSRDAISGGNLRWLDDPSRSADADVVLIATPWPIYSTMVETVRPREGYVDPWGIITREVECLVLQPGRSR